MVLLSDYCKKPNRITPRFHINDIQSMSLHQIYSYMQIPTNLRPTPEYTKRHSFRTLISYRTKKRPPYVTQGSKNTLDLMNIRQSECITWKHIRYLIEEHKLYMRCSGSLLSNNFPPLFKRTPNTWITNTWKFLCHKNIVVEEKTQTWNLNVSEKLISWKTTSEA